MYLSTALGSAGRRNELPYEVVALSAGLAPSIVPDLARLELRWRRGTPAWHGLLERLATQPVAEGTRLESSIESDRLLLSMYGKSAHGGVNLKGGRNALVALANVVQGELPPCGETDLLEFARLAGADLYGTGLGLTREDPIWGRYAVNVATIAPAEDSTRLELVIVLRRTPPMSGAELRAHLAQFVSDFNARTGANLVPAEHYYDDDPIAFDPQGKLVQRLLAAYTRATGTVEKPAIAGGGTYAKRLPNSIAFGMWFPGVPYPGHDVDEKISLAILQRGTHVLLEALHDLACAPPLEKPFEP